MDELEDLATEARNPDTLDLDRLPTLELVRALNREDQKVAQAVAAVLPEVARAVDLVADRLAAGGRLFYVGAGTSGRIGALDAAECPPTFGVPPEMVQAVLAGGEAALTRAVEGAEDDAAAGAAAMRERGVGPRDVVVGIAASGRTPFVVGALEEARRLGAATVAVANNRGARIAALADVAIIPETGPEAILGSTRLKAGTAQKMVLNMISTGAMVKLGKVYSNLMVDMVPANEKLRARAVRMVALATGVTHEEAAAALDTCGHAKVAIVHLLTGAAPTACQQVLAAVGGRVREAVQKLAGTRD